MNQFSTNFWLCKSKKNSQNLCPIYCRVTINGRRTEKSTNIYIAPEEWSSKRQKIISKASEHLNDRLFNFKVGIEKQLIKIEKKHGNITIESFKKKEVPIPTAIDAYKSYVAYRQNDLTSVAAIKSLTTYCNVFEKFALKNNLKNLLISEVNVGTIDAFVLFLRSKKMTNANAKKKIGYSSNVIRKAIRQLQVVVEYMYNQQVIYANPLAFYKPRLETDRKTMIFLEQSELQILEGYKFSKLRLQHAADLFIFQCYTGFSYNELVSFDAAKDTKLWKDTLFIQKARGKTGTECLLPFLSNAQRIYNKYNKSLPLLTNQKYNAYLKEIGKMIGFNKKLTTHVARKTAAMMFYENGASEQIVAKMLGHTTAKTTFNFYAQVRESVMIRFMR
ncbi:MAG: site-specific integrase [Cytophagales bacterium]|nr:MAG: site-specific integrase [Cytophagales bacterium]